MIQRLKASRGYTITEILVAGLIVAALSSVALARYNRSLSRFRAAEARQTILSLWSAQKKHELRTGSFTGTIGDLDIELRGSGHFSYSVSSVASALASALSTTESPAYTLSIDSDGVISCATSGSLCAMLGY